MKISALYHVSFEDLGYIRDWISRKGHALTEIRLYEGQFLPDTGSFDMLIIMGGPMNVWDEDKFPWMKDEKELIRRASAEQKAVLGICLGAQLIAVAFGAHVYKNGQKEIGWFPVTFYSDGLDQNLASFLPQKATLFHWHGDTFDLPAGAVLLAGSQATKNQGFILNNIVLAIQFHPEMKKENIVALCRGCREEIVPGDYIQHAEMMTEATTNFPPANRLMDVLLDYLEMNLRRKDAS